VAGLCEHGNEPSGSIQKVGFSTSITKGKCIFLYRLSPETFGYILVLFVKFRESMKYDIDIYE
jgi:hypothetical protein